MRSAKYILVGVLVAVLSPVVAQDLQRLGEQEPAGTARYVGMGGAMTAVGGDPSAVKDNPAGLGVYRRMEVSLSFDQRLSAAFGSAVQEANGYDYSFMAPQFSWVFAIGNEYRDKGVLFNNIMLSYHRLRTYNRDISVAAKGQQSSLADVICLATNGLSVTEVSEENRWNNENVGWLSNQAYDIYLIDPVAPDAKEWVTPLSANTTIDNKLNIRESGYVNEYAADWAMNISNRVFVGAGLRMLSFRYTQSADYYEQFTLAGDAKRGDLYNQTSLIMSGVGINGSIGVIYHPVRCLRLGASFQTPSLSSLSVQSSGDLSALTDSVRLSSTPSFSSSGNRIYMPLRSSMGVAFQLRQYGLLSFQYDYLHAKDIDDVHSLRVGLEVVPVSRLFINAGYVYESSFLKEDVIYEHGINSVRTDTNFQNLLSSQYISAGIGYRGKSMIAQLAYQLCLQRTHIYPHELANPYDVQTQTHRIVLTLGWHTR